MPPEQNADPSPDAIHKQPVAGAESASRRGKKRTPLWVRLVRIAAMLGVLVGVLAVTGWAERLFYFPVRETYAAPPGAADVWFESEGRRLHGWFYPSAAARAGGRAPTIVHSHGNAFNISRHDVFADFLVRDGFNVLIFDYRSYGMSDRGPLQRDGLVADMLAAVDYAMTRDDVDPARVGVYGLSLGGTIALAAAAEDPRVAAVCSVATFSSWRGVAGDYVPLLNTLLIREGRDAIESVTRLGDRPLLLLHGTADEIVPFRHGPILRDAAAAAGVDVGFQAFEGARHAEWINETPEMRAAISAFFRRTLRDAE